MADQHTTVFRGPETPEAFLADRQRFWSSWTHFTLGSVILVVVVLVLMALFLL
jgi:hypothetical protein